MQDMVMLKSQVKTMLIVLQIVNQIQETILPIFLRRPSTRKILNKMNKHFDEKQKDDVKGSEQCLHREVDKINTFSEDDYELAHSIFNLKTRPYGLIIFCSRNGRPGCIMSTAKYSKTRLLRNMCSEKY